MIRNYFEPRGYKVFVASEGETGLKIAGAEKPDVALIDLKMPGLHGEEVLKKMKEVSPKTVSIIISASQGEMRKREHFLELGAFECFDKPLTSLRDLESKIKEALGRR